MKESEFIVVTTTVASFEEASAIASHVISERLGRCAQIKEVESFYLWQDELVSSKEFEVSIKTIKKCHKRLRKAIREITTYELPQIIATPIIGGDKEYLQWVKQGLI